MRRLIAIGVGLVLVVATAGSVEARASVSLRSLRSGDPARRIDPRLLTEGPGAVLLAAADATGRFPVGCGTAMVLEISRPADREPEALRQARAYLAALPVMPGERTESTRDGRFTIHFATGPSTPPALIPDRDRNGVPDRIDLVAEALQASASFLVARLDYPAPSPGGAPLDLYLTRLGRDLEGLTVPLPSPAAGGPPAFIVIDESLAQERVMPAILHQVAHASLLRLAVAQADPWWVEATAAFLTVTATGDVVGVTDGLRARLTTPGRGLADDDLAIMEGSLLWPLFLAETSGSPGIVRDIWEEMASSAAGPVEATRRVLRRSGGRTLEGAFREYIAWNLFTGSRDDGLHFAFARSLPETSLTPVSPVLPLDLDPVEGVAPLGSVAFLLPGDGAPGSLQIDVAADGGRPAADQLVAHRGSPARLLVPVPLDAAGLGRVAMPWNEVGSVWLVLRNEAAEPGATARFSVRGRSDPYAPFDLAAFNAQVIGGLVQLDWTTASESGLMGWNILRSEQPGGPFIRLNDVAVPAYGDGSRDTGYIYIDDGARPGRRYYYRLEGLTRPGLFQHSHVVSAKTPGR